MALCFGNLMDCAYLSAAVNEISRFHGNFVSYLDVMYYMIGSTVSLALAERSHLLW
jgi:hypothetical protein